MENTIPTAEETYTKVTGCIINHKDVKQAMIEFAKLHVEAALKAAAKECDNEIEKDFINDELILNSYSLSIIK